MSKLTKSETSSGSALAEQDYEAIEAAVMETARGRWFLQEYANRNRTANTDQILYAVERLGQKLDLPATVPHQAMQINPTEIRISLGEMQQAIDLTRHEIMSLMPPEGYSDPFSHSTGELDLVVDATEKATQNILAHAESVQEVAWLLREQHAEPSLCDRLDANATEIYMACSFQDLTGQRIRKVISALQFIEERVNTMIKVWMDDGAQGKMPHHEHNAAPWLPSASLANGPAAPGMGLDQEDVDAVLATRRAQAEPISVMVPDVHVDAIAVAPEPIQKVQSQTPVAANLDMKSMSIEEKLALFS